jgi:hypothetical protein
MADVSLLLSDGSRYDENGRIESSKAALVGKTLAAKCAMLLCGDKQTSFRVLHFPRHTRVLRILSAQIYVSSKTALVGKRLAAGVCFPFQVVHHSIARRTVSDIRPLLCEAQQGAQNKGK